MFEFLTARMHTIISVILPSIANDAHLCSCIIKSAFVIAGELHEEPTRWCGIICYDILDNGEDFSLDTFELLRPFPYDEIDEILHDSMVEWVKTR